MKIDLPKKIHQIKNLIQLLLNKNLVFSFEEIKNSDNEIVATHVITYLKTTGYKYGLIISYAND
jgi:hypothetical protein